MQEFIYFVFNVGQQFYGIEREHIEEVFLLPEFVATSDATHNVVGVVNLRGISLPLISLNTTVEHHASDYHLTDRVIVLRCSDFKVGIIVHKIHEEITVTPEETATEYLENQQSTDGIQNKIVAGYISKPEAILLLKKPEDWIDKQAIVSVLETVAGESKLYICDFNQSQPSNSEASFSESSAFSQNATPQEKRIFRERANRLSQPLQKQNLDESTPLAVVGFGEHIWGIDLRLVREFIDVRNLTPIPCCPRHIIGNTNYRGEILTLVDIRQVLGLSLPETLKSLRAIVVETEDIVAGILIDKVYDAMFLLAPQNTRVETATMASIQNSYLQNTAFYGTETMGILNLPKLLLSPELQVDEII